MRAARIGALGLAAALLVALPSHAVVTPGERTFIDPTPVVFPPSVLAYIGASFPEKVAIGGAFISSTYDPNLDVTADATVNVTFMYEGAGYLNSLGYFTYAQNGSSVSILSRQLIFPNASFADPSKGWGGGQLVTGDEVWLRDADGAVRVFHAGEKIGFFLVAQGWNTQAVVGWDPKAPALPYDNALQNRGVASGVYTSLDELNPEAWEGRPDLARHVALVKVLGTQGFLDGEDYYAMGFEDMRRTGGADDDFNDVMFMVRATPPDAVAPNVLSIDPNASDPDGDGVIGTADYFPSDPARAFVTRTPASSWDTIAFEDSYPIVGDADYNDAVIQLAYEQVTDAQNRIKEVVGTCHLVARGAGYDHAFGVAIGAPFGATGTIAFERFDAAGTATEVAPAPIAFAKYSDASDFLDVGVFPSTRAALPITFANTDTATPTSPPASARFRIVFDTPLAAGALPPGAFDPYLAVKREDGLHDVHLAGKKAFLVRAPNLPPETGPTSFVDVTFHPFALAVPYDWRWPMEKVFIDGGAASAYPSFAPWRAGKGTTNLDWYKLPNLVTASRVVDPVANASRARPWTLTAGH